MEEVVPMLINDHSHKTANDAKSRNDSLDEPEHFPGFPFVFYYCIVFLYNQELHFRYVLLGLKI